MTIDPSPSPDPNPDVVPSGDPVPLEPIPTEPVPGPSSPGVQPDQPEIEPPTDPRP